MVFGHFSDSRFCQVFPSAQIYAVCSVSVFFVLSGFVISYVAHGKEHDALTYTSARMGRLYSVLVPAVMLSLAIQLGVSKLDPGFLAQFTYNYDPAGAGASLWTIRPWIKSLAPLTFLGQIHGLAMFPALDGPMWSIGFEACYYAMFGVLLFTRGILRWVALGFLACIAGTDMLRLLPAWAAGVGLYHLTKGSGLWWKSRRAGITAAGLLGAQFAAWPRLRSWSLQPHSERIEHLLHGHRFSSSADFYYYWAFATCLSIVAVMAFEGEVSVLLSRVGKPVRWLAGHTFSIYLFHFPLFVLFYALTHYNRTSLFQSSAVFFGDLAACILLSYCFEPTKHVWRSWSFQALQSMRLVRPSQPSPVPAAALTTYRAPGLSRQVVASARVR